MTRQTAQFATVHVRVQPAEAFSATLADGVPGSGDHREGAHADQIAEQKQATYGAARIFEITKFVEER